MAEDWRLEPWGDGVVALVPPLIGDLRMVRYLARAAEPERIAERDAHFQEHHPRQFRILGGRTGQMFGWMAYWERRWADAPVLELGWAVLPGFEDEDLGGAAAQAVAAARSERTARLLYACPSADNPVTNAACRASGFTLVETQDLEYAEGRTVTCNVWRLDLHAGPR